MLLDRIQEGDCAAMDALFEHLVVEIRGSACALMANQPSDHTLQPTALINEACARLLKEDVAQTAPNRRYLYAAANNAMKRVLVDYARMRSCLLYTSPSPRDATLSRMPSSA